MAHKVMTCVTILKLENNSFELNLDQDVRICEPNTFGYQWVPSLLSLISTHATRCAQHFQR